MEDLLLAKPDKYIVVHQAIPPNVFLCILLQHDTLRFYKPQIHPGSTYNVENILVEFKCICNKLQRINIYLRDFVEVHLGIRYYCALPCFQNRPFLIKPFH